MSLDDLIRRARRLPTDERDVVIGTLRADKLQLPPATGTSITLLPWRQRLAARIRGWFRSEIHRG